MFIITKLNKVDDTVELLNEGKQYKDKESALTEIFENIDKQSEKAYINKINSNQVIEVYLLNKGLIYNSKVLHHTFQIQELQEED